MMKLHYVVISSLVAVSYAADFSAVGCYSDDGTLKYNSKDTYQTSVVCGKVCSAAGYTVFGTKNGGDCYCGNAVPSASTDSSKCNVRCNGYGPEMCGGKDALTVYTLPSYSGSGVSASSTSSPQASTAITTPFTSGALTTSEPTASPTTGESGQNTPANSRVVVVNSGPAGVPTTVIIVQSATPQSSASGSRSTSQGSDSGRKSGNGAVIAGAVIGSIGGLSAVGALVAFLLIRRKRVDDEFESGSPRNPFEPRQEDKLSFGDAGFMAVDQRLNPVMLNDRRLSQGSLADEQDYSRKILRVANPDDS